MPYCQLFPAKRLRVSNNFVSLHPIIKNILKMIDSIIFSKIKGTLEVSVSVYVFKKPEYKMIRKTTDLKAVYA